MSEEQIRCINPHCGVLLFSYGLNTLDDGDRESFEDHVLHCAACRDELSRAGSILRQIGEWRMTLIIRLQSAGLGFEASLSKWKRSRAISGSRAFFGANPPNMS